MSYSNGIVSKPITSKANTSSDLQAATGRSTGNLNQLCADENASGVYQGAIRWFAKNKPVRHTETGELTAAQRQAAGYGLEVPIITAVADLLNDNAIAWKYLRPGLSDGYPERQLDFDGYYSGAPAAIFQQAAGLALTVDTFNPGASAAVNIFLWQRTGGLADRDFADTAGYGNAVGRSTAQKNAVYGSEDIVAGGYTLYDSSHPATLGIAVFNGSTFVAFIGASVAIGIYSPRNNNMYNIVLSGTTLAQGAYTAVACARIQVSSNNYRYIPAHSLDQNYPAKFTLNIGGLSFYAYTPVYISRTSPVSWVRSITSNESTYYVKITVFNDSGTAFSLSQFASRFSCKVFVSGTVVTQSGTQTLDEVEHAATYNSGLSDTSIPAGGSASMVFEVQRVWNSNPAQSAVVIDNGSQIHLTPKLYSSVDGTQLTLRGLTALLDINY